MFITYTHTRTDFFAESTNIKVGTVLGIYDATAVPIIVAPIAECEGKPIGISGHNVVLDYHPSQDDSIQQGGQICVIESGTILYYFKHKLHINDVIYVNRKKSKLTWKKNGKAVGRIYQVNNDNYYTVQFNFWK